MLKPPWKKLMEKFNKPVKSILRNQPELIANKNRLLFKMEGKKPPGHGIYGLLAIKDTWLILSEIKMSETLAIADGKQLK